MADGQAPLERLLAQLQNVLRKAFAIQCRLIEKTLHLLATRHGLGLQAFQRSLSEQLAALLFKQPCTGVILICAGANQGRHHCQ